MPELPEVEVTRLSFAERIQGARVHALRLGKALRWPLGCPEDSLRGLTVGMASRRGKYLWLPLAPGGLLLHLGMSGSLVFGTGLGEPGPHDHFELETSLGTLRLTDPRRFGAVVWSLGFFYWAYVLSRGDTQPGMIALVLGVGVLPLVILYFYSSAYVVHLSRHGDDVVITTLGLTGPRNLHVPVSAISVARPEATGIVVRVTGRLMPFLVDLQAEYANIDAIMALRGPGTPTDAPA